MQLPCRINIAPAAAVLTLATLLLTAAPARAAIDETIPAPQFIAMLEQRAMMAQPREQCFLYTELVHSMTQLAGKQFLDGDFEQGAATLKKIQHYAQLIHQNLANNTKRIKEAEKLMEHTTFHLGEYVHHATGDDQLALQATLKQLDGVHDELLTQVFRH
ncbi:hypothetical protein HDF16_002217 [Granulicella aggregans]|uniref:Uncharacterized protein n=1 Tax=Granulicella aggregans TaxID=474949 RepID=A0A7W8E3I5_9BACT|nr:hypothetical protein [Granulicella aggregans]MBB5057511.1 hypothetical protein [Granulicella aggregans]